MHPHEAVRVVKKHRAWINSRSEFRQALDTIVAHYEAALADVQREVDAEFGRLAAQLEDAK